MNGSGKRSFYEIQLSNSSLIVAFVIAVGLGIAVFMFGVMVGRGQVIESGPGEDLVELFPSGAEPLDSSQATADLQFDASVREPMAGGDDSAAPADPAAQSQDPAPQRQEPRPQRQEPQAIGLPAHDPSIASGFVVQVKATESRSDANSLQAQLATVGYPAFVVSGESAGGATVFRVRVGRYRTKADAERVAALLSQRSDIKDTWITQG